ncbi:S1 family peptidase [Corynebacterium lowii]|nr:S1 family peptidase [Corynebacterium lowii]MDP9851828.1 hypothetical protein [Corynebacterium lowii]
MKKTFAAAAAALALAVSTAPTSGAIEGGHDAIATPWSAKILVKGLCSGSVIAPNWILTAQHCVGDYQAGTVRIGERAEQSFSVDRVVVDPGGSDVALVHTAQPMPVIPAALSTVEPVRGQFSQTSGWGAGRFPMQQGSARVEGRYTDNARGGASMFVTRGVEGNQEPGDSGGPFHMGPMVFGVLSSVGAKDDEGHVGANYTSVAPLLPWVYSTIAPVTGSV